MIIELLMNLILNIFKILTLPINIPDLPSKITETVNTLLSYVSTGLGVLACYTHLDYLTTLLLLVVGVEVGIGIYHLVMFIIKKIPMLNVS